MAQVTKDHYEFGKYTKIDRWSSYYYQLREILRENPESVLEVGVGEGVVCGYLRARGVKYTSLDLAEDLNPDFIGEVTKMPFRDEEFNVVCAFEVLEHLPFAEFPKALLELRRVSKSIILLSLPHFGPPFKFSLKVPFLPEIKFSLKIPFPKKHYFNGEHYWEIGKAGYSLSKIKSEIEKVGKIEKEFVPFENQYHHFFVIRKI